MEIAVEYGNAALTNVLSDCTNIRLKIGKTHRSPVNKHVGALRAGTVLAGSWRGHNSEVNYHGTFLPSKATVQETSLFLNSDRCCGPLFRLQLALQAI